MSELPVAWVLDDLKKVKKKNVKVFSTFSCGGGSSMGYKLAGCEVVGCLEIDEKLMEIYKTNHNPKHAFRMGIQDFNKIEKKDLPPELYDLDLLDGSPPCSVFSMAGAREKKWGEEYFFREGQEVQKLDDLFFHYIDTVKKLQPKVAIAENVTGLLQGNARGYVKEIFLGLQEAGYEVQLFKLNAAEMSVPQVRRRVFFIARRKDLGLPKIELKFNDKQRNYYDMVKGINDFGERKEPTALVKDLWRRTAPGTDLGRAHPKGHFFGYKKINPNIPIPCVLAAKHTNMLWDRPLYFSRIELVRAQTFPDDFDFCTQDVQYVTGMSVPPYMVKKIADQIIDFWNLG
jgi:DNA (cytosine-5)-methyltransferase 1|tara:strand:- start:920 stop:1951 length:1032 start_codon:yes stop_codon:yes gene_type:complete